MPKQKSRVISVRINENLYNFLRDVSKEMSSTKQLTINDLLKSIIEYFFLAYSLGDFKKPLPQLRSEFRKFLKSLSKS